MFRRWETGGLDIMFCWDGFVGLGDGEKIQTPGRDLVVKGWPCPGGLSLVSHKPALKVPSE
jgi:hypothetical protein